MTLNIISIISPLTKVKKEEDNEEAQLQDEEVDDLEENQTPDDENNNSFDKFIFGPQQDDEGEDASEMIESEGEGGSNNSDQEGSVLEVAFTEENMETEKYKPNSKLVQITAELEEIFGSRGEEEEEQEEEQNIEEEVEGDGESEPKKPPTLAELVSLELQEPAGFKKMNSLVWFQNLPENMKYKLFRMPRPDLVNIQNAAQSRANSSVEQGKQIDDENIEESQKERQLGSSERELRRAQGWYRKLVELETLGESLDSSRNDLRCHILCPGAKYGFGQGVFAEVLQRLWVRPEMRAIPIAKMEGLGNVLPMIHFQDLAMGGKWFIIRAKDPKTKKPKVLENSDSLNRSIRDSVLGSVLNLDDKVMGFYESVFENEWREIQKRESEVEEVEENEDSETVTDRFDVGERIHEMVQKARVKRRRTKHKDGYVLICDKDRRGTVGHRLETVIKDLIDIDPKSQKAQLAREMTQANQSQTVEQIKGLGAVNGQKGVQRSQNDTQQSVTAGKEEGTVRFVEGDRPFFLPKDDEGGLIFETPFSFRSLHKQTLRRKQNKSNSESKLMTKIQEEVEEIEEKKNPKKGTKEVRKLGKVQTGMVDLVLKKDFRMKRSQFLDAAKNARCWEKILEDQKEEGLRMGELQGQAKGGEGEGEGEGGGEGLAEDEDEEQYDVPGKVEWEGEEDEDQLSEQDDNEAPKYYYYDYDYYDYYDYFDYNDYHEYYMYETECKEELCSVHP